MSVSMRDEDSASPVYERVPTTTARASMTNQERRNEVAATGMSIICAAVGAILFFAVADVVNGFDVAGLGITFMIAGGLGLIVSDVLIAKARLARDTNDMPHTIRTHGQR